LLKTEARKELEDDYEYYTEDVTYWVDFLRDPPEATGDEPEDFSFDAPKIYEEVPSWEFLKEKLFGIYNLQFKTCTHLSFKLFRFHGSIQRASQGCSNGSSTFP
jgi:hypothetical protein